MKKNIVIKGVLLSILWFILYTAFTLFVSNMFTLKSNNQKSVSIHQDNIKTIVQFRSEYDFFGRVDLHFNQKVLMQADELFIRVWDMESAPIVLYEHTYEVKEVQKFIGFPVGFPIIPVAKGRTFTIEIQPNQPVSGILFDSSVGNPIEMTYVFPKAIIFIPKVFFEFVKVKIIGLLISKSFWMSPFLYIGPLLLFIVYGWNSQLMSVSVKNRILSHSKIFSWIIFASLLVESLRTVYVHPIVGTVFPVKLFIAWVTALLIFPTFRFLSYIIAALCVFAAIVYSAFHTIDQASYYMMWVWIFLAISVTSELLHFCITRIVSTGLRIQKIYFLYACVFIGICIVSTQINTYLLGGDDTRLYYLYPKEYLMNFARYIISNTAISGVSNYFPQIYILPFVLLLFCIKTVFPGINLQVFLFLINISVGLLSFYHLTLLLVQKKSRTTQVIACIGSLLYVLSIYSVYTVYNSLLFAQYLVSIFPLIAYLVYRAIREQNRIFIYISALILSLFSIVLMSLPWMLGLLIVTLPFTGVLFLKYKWVAVRYICLLVICLLLLNIYWIFHIGYGFMRVDDSNTLQSVSSIQTRLENSQGIQSFANLNTVFYPLVNLYQYSIQKAYNWSYVKIFESWHILLIPINAIFFGTIIAAGFIARKNERHFAYWIASLGFALAVFMYTVRIGLWGTLVFLWFNEHIPGFVMFRNMYDKFGLPLAFVFALLFTLSLEMVILSITQVKIRRFLIILSLFVVLINAKPFIFGEYNALPIWTTYHSYYITSSFANDYLDAMKYIRETKDDYNYISLPFNIGNLAVIQDNEKANHFYVGVDPMLIMTGKNSYSGRLSFSASTFRPNEIDIFELIKEKRFDEIGSIFGDLHIGYILVNKTIPYDIEQSYLYRDTSMHVQMNEMLQTFAADKIRDFGSSYSLYTIRDTYKYPKFYINNENKSSVGNVSDVVSYTLNHIGSYELNISTKEKEIDLVFLDPYQQNWELIGASSGKRIPAEHYSTISRMNAWKVDISDALSTLEKSDYDQHADGSVRLKLRVEFLPIRYQKVLYGISLSTAVILFTLIYLGTVKHIWTRKVIHIG